MSDLDLMELPGELYNEAELLCGNFGPSELYEFYAQYWAEVVAANPKYPTMLELIEAFVSEAYASGWNDRETSMFDDDR